MEPPPTLAQCPHCGSWYTPGVHRLRSMEAGRCSWVEYMPDGDYQCDKGPGHWDDRDRLSSHRPTIKLTHRETPPAGPIPGP